MVLDVDGTVKVYMFINSFCSKIVRFTHTFHLFPNNIELNQCHKINVTRLFLVKAETQATLYETQESLFEEPAPDASFKAVERKQRWMI